MTIVISNTSPLIFLAAASALDLVPQVFDVPKFYITKEVRDEIRDKDTSSQVEKLIADGKLEILPEAKDKNLLNSIANEIALSNPKQDPKTWVAAQHIGEASVILAGKEKGADFLLMDDKGGRHVARTGHGLKCLDHFTVIKQAVNKSIINKADALKCLTILKTRYKYENTDYYEKEWSNG